MVLDTSLLNIQHYMICIKSKVERSRERSITLLYISMLYLLKRSLQAALNYNHQLFFYIYKISQPTKKENDWVFFISFGRLKDKRNYVPRVLKNKSFLSWLSWELFSITLCESHCIWLPLSVLLILRAC